MSYVNRIPKTADRTRLGTKHSCLWGNTPEVGAELHECSREDPASCVCQASGSYRGTDGLDSSGISGQSTSVLSHAPGPILPSLCLFLVQVSAEKVMCPVSCFLPGSPCSI